MQCPDQILPSWEKFWNFRKTDVPFIDPNRSKEIGEYNMWSWGTEKGLTHLQTCLAMNLRSSGQTSLSDEGEVKVNKTANDWFCVMTQFRHFMDNILNGTKKVCFTIIL